MTKFILAASVALVATFSFASASNAGSRHNDNALFDIDINFGAKQHRYERDVRYFVPKRVQYDIGYDNDEAECFWKKTKKINRYGELVIKKVQICQ